MAGLRHHAVEIEPSLLVEFEIVRDVIAKAVRAHARGLDLALRTDRHPRERDLGLGRQYADNRRGAAYRQTLDRLPAEFRIADRLEGVIDAEPAGQRAYHLDR